MSKDPKDVIRAVRINIEAATGESVFGLRLHVNSVLEDVAHQFELSDDEIIEAIGSRVETDSATCLNLI